MILKSRNKTQSNDNLNVAKLLTHMKQECKQRKLYNN